MNMLKLPLIMLFHPGDAFYYIKSRRNSINYLYCIMMFFMVVAVRIASIFITHFPLAAVQPRDANIVLEFVKYLLPIVTWVVACYAITSISDGEALFGEVFTAAAYCMVPYIVCTIPIALLSRIMGSEQLALYTALQAIVWIWVLCIYFLSVMNLNNCTFGETIKICIISIITMLLIWGLLILIFALTSQLLQFLKDILLEIKMLFLK